MTYAYVGFLAWVALVCLAATVGAALEWLAER